MTIYEYLGISEKDYYFKRDYVQNPLKKNIIRKGGGLEYEKAYDEDLRFLYIDLNLTVQAINKLIGHKISDYLAKFKKQEYRKKPKLSKEEIIDLYHNQHKSLKEIANMVGYSSISSIEDWLKQYNIKQQSQRYIKNKISKDKLYELYIEKNFSIQNIAKIYHSTVTTISKELKKCNIFKNKNAQQLSRFKSNHTEFQNELLLNADKFEEFIVKNNVKSKKELSKILNLSYSTIGVYLKNFGLKKYFNRYNNSDESLWLDSIGLPNDDKHRQVHIGKYKVDGYDPQTNTIYEYLGDYWHGNPQIFESTNVNLTIGKTFGELYEKTMNRINDLKNMGFNVVYVWEHDINPR